MLRRPNRIWLISTTGPNKRHKQHQRRRSHVSRRCSECFRHCVLIDVFRVNVWLVAEPKGISTCARTSVPAVTGIEVGLSSRASQQIPLPSTISTSRGGGGPPVIESASRVITPALGATTRTLRQT